MFELIYLLIYQFCNFQHRSSIDFCISLFKTNPNTILITYLGINYGSLGMLITRAIFANERYSISFTLFLLCFIRFLGIFFSLNVRVADFLQSKKIFLVMLVYDLGFRLYEAGAWFVNKAYTVRMPIMVGWMGVGGQDEEMMLLKNLLVFDGWFRYVWPFP